MTAVDFATLPKEYQDAANALFEAGGFEPTRIDTDNSDNMNWIVVRYGPYVSLRKRRGHDYAMAAATEPGTEHDVRLFLGLYGYPIEAGVRKLTTNLAGRPLPLTTGNEDADEIARNVLDKAIRDRRWDYAHSYLNLEHRWTKSDKEEVRVALIPVREWLHLHESACRALGLHEDAASVTITDDSNYVIGEGGNVRDDNYTFRDGALFHSRRQEDDYDEEDNTPPDRDEALSDIRGHIRYLQSELKEAELLLKLAEGSQEFHTDVEPPEEEDDEEEDDD